MRTSRISQETARLIAVSSTRRSTRAKKAPETSVKDGPDIEDAIPPPVKRRKVSAGSNSSLKRESIIKTELDIAEQSVASPIKASRVRKPARKVKNEETGEVEVRPPNDWEEVYAVVKTMRTTGNAQNAAVDTMGCERVGQNAPNPRDKRYHTLTSLMLSSQTKDTTNALAMSRLINELPPHMEGAPPGLNLENIHAVDPKLLNELIWAVGFHNNKTKYIKATASILLKDFAGDIPDTVEGLMSLPGVGPKMAYLCLSSAWGRTEGIGVDVHVHRITNLWGWQKTNDPEKTRLALQAWLPREKWHEINWLLVGLGQTVCLPVGRKCGDCDLGLQGLCKAADRAKVSSARKSRELVVKYDSDGEVKESTEKATVKHEDGIIAFSKSDKGNPDKSLGPTSQMIKEEDS